MRHVSISTDGARAPSPREAPEARVDARERTWGDASVERVDSTRGAPVARTGMLVVRLHALGSVGTVMVTGLLP